MHPGLIGAAAKRTLDLAGATLGCIVFAPVMLAAACAIRLRMGSPVLFRQVRPGLEGRPFTMLKFRTMMQSQSLSIDPSTDAERLTSVGRLLRRLSIDELPQLWLVLKGDMSLVGPRPLLTEYLALYTSEQAKRHNMKPGITGLTAIKGRNALSWEEKFAIDAWYVDHWSFWLDMKILMATIGKAIRGAGVSQQGHVTMEKFGAGHK